MASTTSSSPLPQTMQAWTYRSSGKPAEVLKLESDRPLPTLQGYPIIVKVKCAALNPVGYKTIYEMPSFVTKKPATPEQDFSGVIAGGDLSGTSFKVGDEVFGILPADKQVRNGLGVLGDYTVASPACLVAKPKNISFAEAASVPLAGLTAHASLFRSGNAKSGDRVLINGGTGGVGIWAIQLAKAAGCYVVATCSAEKAQMVKELGADETVDYKQQDLFNNLNSMYGSSNKRFDVVFDTIGVPAFYSNVEGYIKPEGRFCNISFDSKTTVGALKSFAALADFKLRPTILGGKKIPYNLVMLNAEQETDALKQMAIWLEEGKIKAVVDSEYSFQDVANAYEKIMSGRSKGKVVVNVS